MKGGGKAPENRSIKILKKPKTIICILLITVLAVMFYLLFFSQMPLGGDVLFMFRNSIYAYLDGYHFSAAAGMVASFSDIAAEIGQQYMVWHARVLPKLVYYFCMLAPPWLSSIVDVAVMILICLFATSVIENCSFLAAFQYPVWILFIGVVGIWYGPGIAYIRMQMFMSMYALPLLFYIIYYKLHRSLLAKGHKASTKDIVRLTVVGVCAGSMHEVFGVYPIIMISFEMLLAFLRKEISRKKLLYHAGYLAGYLSCVLHPVILSHRARARGEQYRCDVDEAAIQHPCA